MLFRSRSLFRCAIIAALCSAMALLASCSMLRLGYSQAPELAYWWLDAYVDFDREQTPKVREALDDWFAWHRRSQLPEYAALLGRAQVEVAADTMPARVCEWKADLTARAYRAWEHAAPATARLALSLAPQQVQQIERRFAKVNEEFRSDFLQADPDDRRRATFKRTVDRAESLYGSLSDAQRAQIHDELKRSPFNAETWFAERRQRQQEILATLRQFSGEGRAVEPLLAALREQAQRIENSPRGAYVRYAQRLDEFNCAFAAALHNGMSPAQRQHAAKKLANWADDLRALAVAVPR